MGIEDYSTTPASNNSASPNGFPENMAPSGVNDSARQVMADIRTWYENAEWIDFGDTITYVSGTQFTVATDLTGRYAVARRIKVTGSGTGTIYGIITVSSFSSPNTTVTVNWDSGSMSNETLTAYVGIVHSENSSLDYAALSGGATFFGNGIAYDSSTKVVSTYAWETVAVTTASADALFTFHHDGIDSGSDFVDGWSYRIDLNDVYPSVAAQLLCQLYEGAAYRTASNSYVYEGLYSTGGAASGYGAQNTYWIASAGGNINNADGAGVYGTLIFRNLASTSSMSQMDNETYHHGTSTNYKAIGGNRVSDSSLTEAAKYLKLYMSGGATMTAGTLTLLRRKDAT